MNILGVAPDWVGSAELEAPSRPRNQHQPPPMMKLRLAAALTLVSAAALAADPNPLGLQLWSVRAQLTASLPSGMAQVRALAHRQIARA